MNTFCEVRQILKVCKEHARMSAVNMHSQNYVGHNRALSFAALKYFIEVLK